jgi:hypothetical protein
MDSRYKKILEMIMKVTTCKCGFLEEIHGFISPNEYERFVNYISSQVVRGNLIEVKMNNNYSKGEIVGGKWYKCSGCNEIWRLVPPDYPFRGLWEKVDKWYNFLQKLFFHDDYY